MHQYYHWQAMQQYHAMQHYHAMQQRAAAMTSTSYDQYQRPQAMMPSHEAAASSHEAIPRQDTHDQSTTTTKNSPSTTSDSSTDSDAGEQKDEQSGSLSPLPRKRGTGNQHTIQCTLDAGNEAEASETKSAARADVPPKKIIEVESEHQPKKKARKKRPPKKKITQEETPVHEENPKRKRRKKIKSKATEKKTFAAPQKKSTMKKQRKKKKRETCLSAAPMATDCDDGHVKPNEDETEEVRQKTENTIKRDKESSGSTGEHDQDMHKRTAPRDNETQPEQKQVIKTDNREPLTIPRFKQPGKESGEVRQKPENMIKRDKESSGSTGEHDQDMHKRTVPRDNETQPEQKQVIKTDNREPLTMPRVKQTGKESGNDRRSDERQEHRRLVDRTSNTEQRANDERQTGWQRPTTGRVTTQRHEEQRPHDKTRNDLTSGGEERHERRRLEDDTRHEKRRPEKNDRRSNDWAPRDKERHEKPRLDDMKRNDKRSDDRTKGHDPMSRRATTERYEGQRRNDWASEDKEQHEKRRFDDRKDNTEQLTGWQHRVTNDKRSDNWRQGNGPTTERTTSHRHEGERPNDRHYTSGRTKSNAKSYDQSPRGATERSYEWKTKQKCHDDGKYRYTTWTKKWVGKIYPKPQ